MTFYTQAEFEANWGRTRAAWIANLRHEQQNNISYYRNAEIVQKLLNFELRISDAVFLSFVFVFLFCSFKVYTSSFFLFGSEPYFQVQFQFLGYWSIREVNILMMRKAISFCCVQILCPPPPPPPDTHNLTMNFVASRSLCNTSVIHSQIN